MQCVSWIQLGCRSFSKLEKNIVSSIERGISSMGLGLRGVAQSSCSHAGVMLCFSKEYMFNSICIYYSPR